MGAHCGSPHQSQQRLPPVPGQTCLSAQLDPGGQSAPLKTTRCSAVLQAQMGNDVGLRETFKEEAGMLP